MKHTSYTRFAAVFERAHQNMLRRGVKRGGGWWWLALALGGIGLALVLGSPVEALAQGTIIADTDCQFENNRGSFQPRRGLILPQGIQVKISCIIQADLPDEASSTLRVRTGLKFPSGVVTSLGKPRIITNADSLIDVVGGAIEVKLTGTTPRGVRPVIDDWEYKQDLHSAEPFQLIHIEISETDRLPEVLVQGLEISAASEIYIQAKDELAKAKQLEPPTGIEDAYERLLTQAEDWLTAGYADQSFVATRLAQSLPPSEGLLVQAETALQDARDIVVPPARAAVHQALLAMAKALMDAGFTSQSLEASLVALAMTPTYTQESYAEARAALQKARMLDAPLDGEANYQSLLERAEALLETGLPIQSLHATQQALSALAIYSQAEEALKMARSKDPPSGREEAYEQLVTQAVAFLKADLPSESLDTTRLALALSPRYTQAIFAQAEATLKTARLNDPPLGREEGYQQLLAQADVLLEADFPSQSLAATQLALTLFPLDTQAEAELAKAKGQEVPLDREDDYQRLLTQAEVLLSAGFPSQSLLVTQRALAMLSGYADALFVQAEAALEKAKEQAAPAGRENAYGTLLAQANSLLKAGYSSQSLSATQLALSLPQGAGGIPWLLLLFALLVGIAGTAAVTVSILHYQRTRVAVDPLGDP